MRVALYNLTTTTKIGGVESFVWDLSRELGRRGHDVTIIGGVGRRREDASGARVLTFPFVGRAAWQALPPLRRAYAEAKLLERLTLAVSALPELARGGYDVIHLQKPYDIAPALVARRLGGPRVVLGCHGEDFYRGDQALARMVDGAVSCSHFNARTVAARYGFEPQVVFNGVDIGHFQPAAPDQDIRRMGERLLLFVGRFQPWKGVEHAIRALPHIPGARLLLAGDGVDRERLQGIADQLELGDRVIFLGPVGRERLPALFAAVDLLLATSFASETFGIVPVEAQASGLPVVATRFGGFPEVIDEGRTGLLVPPQDPLALAEAVNTLLDDQALRLTMAASGPGWAAQFAWPAVADRVEATYKTVLGRW